MLAVFYVYILFDLCGIPCYVGKGKDSRWLDHEREGEKHANRRLRKLVLEARAAGRALPKIKLIESVPEKTAFAYEIAFIAAIGRGAKGPLFNQTDGGEGATGCEYSAEARAAISTAQKRRFERSEEREKVSLCNKGKPLSVEARAAITTAMRNGGTARAVESLRKTLNVMAPEERKEKFGAHNIGRNRSPETAAKQKANNPGHKGHHHSEAAKEKIRAAALRQMASPEQRAQRRLTALARKFSDETRRKLSNSVRASWVARRAVLSQQSF